MFHPLTHIVFAIALAIGSLCYAQTTKPREPYQGTPPLPTMDELREMYESGDYRTAVQQIARVQRLRGAPAEPYDPDALQLLRGQTLLALDDPRSARRAFEEAKKSKQGDIAMKASGYVALIDRSKRNVYPQRSGDRAEISITDPKTQPAAFLAALEDDLPVFQKSADSATKADNLAPAIALIPKLLELAGMEFAGTGSYERMKPVAQPVGEHARKLTRAELTMQEQRVTAIENLANQVMDTGGYRGRAGRRGGMGWSDDVSRRGLVSDERESLHQLVEYLAKIEDTVHRGRSIAEAVQGDVAAWDQLLEQAAQVKTHAQFVLEAEGVRTVNDTSK